MVYAAPAPVHLCWSGAVVPGLDEELCIFKGGLDDPLAFEVDVAPIASTIVLDRIEPMAKLLVIIPFVASLISLA